MAGDASGSGGGSGDSSEEAEAEAQYVGAKTSVWWGIENCQVAKGSDVNAIAQNISSALVKLNYRGPVSISAYGDTNRLPATVQQALSSTGISLNHVPAGVKDASDKKILVDMLFWAVDNPAPANYLLISGDRDFSNALHQLPMRRYNILLAQPQNASAPLVAAAKSVWLWTSLSAGGSPLTTGESSRLANAVPADAQSKGSFSQKNPNQTIPEIKGNNYSYQPEHTQVKQFKKAPHEFFGLNKSQPVESASGNTPNSAAGDPRSSGSNGNNFVGNPPYLYPLPTRSNFHYFPSHPQNYVRSMPLNAEDPKRSSIEPMNPDIGKLSISEYPNYAQRPHNNFQRVGGDLKPVSIYHPGSKGSLPPSEHVQALIGVILLSLNTLKTEKLMPTEANIKDCILYGEPKYRNTDVRKALDCAVEQHMIVKQNLGVLQLYVGRNDTLWNCVNPIGGNSNQYPKIMWDGIKKFLASSTGRTALLASKRRYEAALVLKGACLREFTLGDVLQILNMLCTTKKWIIPHHSGWQPIKITLATKN